MLKRDKTGTDRDEVPVAMNSSDVIVKPRLLCKQRLLRAEHIFAQFFLRRLPSQLAAEISRTVCSPGAPRKGYGEVGRREVRQASSPTVPDSCRWHQARQ